MSIYLGIDGGGTATTVLATDASGGELARVRGGATLVSDVEADRGADALAELVHETVEKAGGTTPAAAACFALAGAGRAAARVVLRDAIERAGIARRVVVTTDAEAALQDAFGTGPGLLLISGTGSIAWGRGPDGRCLRAGGWGVRLGDEGSGYALALEALRAGMRAHDGRGPDTLLFDRLAAALSVDSPDALVEWIADASKRDVAALAPEVSRAAESGDAVARALVDAAAGALVTHIVALHRRLSPWPVAPAVALAGGLLAADRPLRQPVIARLDDADLAYRLLTRGVDAARGAAAIARRPRAGAP